MHFHEALKQSIHDFGHERQQLEELFSNTKWTNYIAFMGQPSSESLEMFLESDFRRSRVRGTASSFKSFFAYHAKEWMNPSLNGLFYYAEMMLNILDEFREKINRHPDAKSISDQIEENIAQILDETIHTTIRTRDGFIAIIPKDPMVATVVEDLPDTDKEAASAILEYTHVGLKGNVERKRELLRTIGHFVEPILQNPEMKKTYSWLTEELGCSLNSLHIRHNNKAGKNANAVAQAMSDGELEECYDNTYRDVLLLIELQKNLPFRRKVEGLREQLKGKKDGCAG